MLEELKRKVLEELKRTEAIGLLLHLTFLGDFDDSGLTDDDIRGMRDEDLFEWMKMLGYEHNGRGWFTTTHPYDPEE